MYDLGVQSKHTGVLNYGCTI